MWFNKDVHKTVAKVHQGALVFYAPSAQTPCLWRVNLSDLQAAQFSLVSNNEGYLLQWVTPSAQPQIVAVFDDKAQAQMALNSILSALFKGTNVVANINEYVDKVWSLGRVIKWFFIIVLILLLVSIGRRFFSSDNAVQPAVAVATNQTTSPAANATEQLEPGKPMNADDILKNLD